MTYFTDRAKSMATRNGLESREHGAGVEAWKGDFKIFISPGKRPCRVNLESTSPFLGGDPITSMNNVEWVLLESILRNVGRLA